MWAGRRLEVGCSVSRGMADAAPDSSEHLLPLPHPPKLVPVLTNLLGDILQLFISSPAVQLVTTAKPRDEIRMDCLAVVTAYMLLL